VRHCYYCREEVKDEAIKCKHCHSTLLDPEHQAFKLELDAYKLKRDEFRFSKEWFVSKIKFYAIVIYLGAILKAIFFPDISHLFPDGWWHFN